jgi:hypothetical protein
MLVCCVEGKVKGAAGLKLQLHVKPSPGKPSGEVAEPVTRADKHPLGVFLKISDVTVTFGASLTTMIKSLKLEPTASRTVNLTL